MPEFTGVSHLELTVRDADQSAIWYEQTLGMKRLATNPEHDAPGVSARLCHVMHMASNCSPWRRISGSLFPDPNEP